ncbi:hypothetical protein H4219_005619 [Mycoemilia scoparia]|uniref:Uncharacterized protein n=1 Tax=Mycoemilia scoparia TaxID=417184 RepID=A0A9W7ZT73_9FUNG|nr:hypothetical protein H4219_005619 [Mycoemilia scoparia]
MSRLVQTLAQNQISCRPDFQHIRNVGEKKLFGQFKEFVEGIGSQFECMGFDRSSLELYKFRLHWKANELYHILKVMDENDIDYWFYHFSDYIPKLFEGARVCINDVQSFVDKDLSSQEVPNELANMVKLYQNFLLLYIGSLRLQAWFQVNAGFEPKNIPIEKGYVDLTMQTQRLFGCLKQNFGKIPEAIRNELKEFNVSFIFNEDVVALDKEIVHKLNYAKKSLWFDLDDIPEHIKL